MQEADKERFMKVMVVLSDMFGRKVSAELIGAYFGALNDLPIEQVEKAGALAMQSLKFFPKPVELRELVEGSADDKAQQAWTLFWQACGQIGRYASVQFEEPALAETIVRTFGGWPQACAASSDLSDEMLVAKQREFKANYRLASRQSPEKLPRYLAGLHEFENRQKQPEHVARLRGLYAEVGLIGTTGIRKLRAPWDTQTGALNLIGLEELPEFAPIERRQLPSGDEVPAPAEVKEALTEFTKKVTVP